MNLQTSWFHNADGSIDFSKLIENFQQFYRENAQSWLEEFVYKESAPHLLMMSFLQLIINGGGSIERKHAYGSRRIDIYIVWPYGNDKKQRIVIKLKVLLGSKTLPEGLKQTADYIDGVGADQGHLIIFDKDKKKD